MVSTELPWEKFALAKSSAEDSPSSNPPAVNSPEENSPRGKFPRGKLPRTFSQIIFVEKMFLLLKIWFLFTREINMNIYNRLYLFINKTDYLSDAFNINKMHSNKDLDLI